MRGIATVSSRSSSTGSVPCPGSQEQTRSAPVALPPRTEPWRVVGLDPGLHRTGYAVLEAVREQNAWQPHICEAGILRAPPARRRVEALAERLRILHDSLVEVLQEWQPAALAIEQLYSHYAHPRTAILMAHARGVFLLAGAVRRLPVIGYPATRIKKLITGSGRASKAQIQYAIAAQLHLDRLPQPPDVADALAVALCHFLASTRSLPQPPSHPGQVAHPD
jgi:crossover junction endodeoxyribonuclease RuvC